MSLFSKILGKSTKQTQTGTSTITGSNRTYAPDWALNPAMDLTKQVTGLGAADPQSYIAGADPLQSQAGAAAGALTGTPWNFDAALGLTGGVAGADAARTAGVRASKFIPDYLSPFTKDVTDAATADLDFNAGNVRGQQALDLAGSGAFGGSGAALTQSMTEGELARARASTLADIRSHGFDTAVSAAQGDANRFQGANDRNAELYAGHQDRTLSAADQIARIAQGFGGEQRANIATQLGTGDALRGIEQEKAQAPLNLASWNVDNLTALISKFFGSDTTGTTNSTSTGTGSTSDPLGTAGKVAQIAALFGSDRRIKRNIVRLWRRRDGLWLYLFRYRPGHGWRPGWFIGVMAQEVQRIKPEAVAWNADGYLMVDYAQI